MKFFSKIILAIVVCTLCSVITFAAVQGGQKHSASAKKEAAAPKRGNSAVRKITATESDVRNTDSGEAARKDARCPGPGKDEYGREYVDLDLPGGVLWATCNVGASSPWQYGLYFAWGEATGYAKGERHTFDWAHYKWHKGKRDSMTKYCTRTSDGIVDNKSVLDAVDDAATANWGAAWRMPTKQEISDLIDSRYTTSKWVTVKGVHGRQITSKSNGNSIFLPAAGYRGGTSLGGEKVKGIYWSCEMRSSYNLGAYYMSFDSDVVGMSYLLRLYGHSVRAVRVGLK